MSGEAVFYQNCTFCHEHSNQKRALIPQFLGPTLIGLYESKPELSDDCRAGAYPDGHSDTHDRLPIHADLAGSRRLVASRK